MTKKNDVFFLFNNKNLIIMSFLNAISLIIINFVSKINVD